MKTWQDIQGWFDWQAIYDEWITLAEPGTVIVEIGAWLGRSTCYAGKVLKASGKDIKFVAVDHCIGSIGAADEKPHSTAVNQGGGTIAGILHRNLIECGLTDVVIPIVAASKRAACLFADNSVGFVFVDGGHDYTSVKKDLESWWPKVKSGGRMAGHDYSPKWPEVVKAVDDFFCGKNPSSKVKSCWEKEKL